jgi:hypothetical protein
MIVVCCCVLLGGWGLVDCTLSDQHDINGMHLSCLCVWMWGGWRAGAEGSTSLHGGSPTGGHSAGLSLQQSLSGDVNRH